MGELPPDNQGAVYLFRHLRRGNHRYVRVFLDVTFNIVFFLGELVIDLISLTRFRVKKDRVTHRMVLGL